MFLLHVQITLARNEAIIYCGIEHYVIIIEIIIYRHLIDGYIWQIFVIIIFKNSNDISAANAFLPTWCY